MILGQEASLLQPGLKRMGPFVWHRSADGSGVLYSSPGTVTTFVTIEDE